MAIAEVQVQAVQNTSGLVATASGFSAFKAANTIIVCVAVILTLAGGPAVASVPASAYQWGGVGTGAGASHVNGLVATVVGLAGVSAIQASNSNTYAIVGGSEESWGYNNAGELGNGTKVNSFVPGAVSYSPGTVITSIGDAEDAGFATDANGVGYSFGENQTGDLCQPGSANKLVPTPVAGLPFVTAVAGGNQHVSFLGANGLVYGCGQNNHGQLGNGQTVNSSTPVQVPGISNIVAISAGWGDTAALSASGSLYIWGFNGQGAVGNGSTNDALTPVQVPGIFSSVNVGGSTAANTHVLAITAAGVVESWGDNTNGELGLGWTSNMATLPQTVTPPIGVTYVSVMAGGPESGAVSTTGHVYMWGGDADSEIGDGNSSGKVLIPFLTDSGRTHLSGTAANVADF